MGKDLLSSRIQQLQALVLWIELLVSCMGLARLLCGKIALHNTTCNYCPPLVSVNNSEDVWGDLDHFSNALLFDTH